MDIGRIIEGDEVTEMASIYCMILSLPKPVQYVDALSVYMGQGEIWRITDAIRIWNENGAIRFLLITPENQLEETFRKYSIENLKEPPFNLKYPENVHMDLNHVVHTGDQADWTIKKIQGLGISSLAISASPYHLVKVYLITLKRLINKNLRIPMIPIPTRVPPDVIIPETQVDAWVMSRAETKKILDCQEKGYAATFEELQAYLKWLWRQPLLTSEIAPGVPL